jgi:hypothetical protein
MSEQKEKKNNKLKYPNFFIVGAPKCGTTSLHYWLSQHPEIFATLKNLNIFTQIYTKKVIILMIVIKIF